MLVSSCPHARHRKAHRECAKLGEGKLWRPAAAPDLNHIGHRGGKHNTEKDWAIRWIEQESGGAEAPEACPGCNSNVMPSLHSNPEPESRVLCPDCSRPTRCLLSRSGIWCLCRTRICPSISMHDGPRPYCNDRSNPSIVPPMCRVAGMLPHWTHSADQVVRFTLTICVCGNRLEIAGGFKSSGPTPLNSARTNSRTPGTLNSARGPAPNAATSFDFVQSSGFKSSRSTSGPGGGDGDVRAGPYLGQSPRKNHTPRHDVLD